MFGFFTDIAWIVGPLGQAINVKRPYKSNILLRKGMYVSFFWVVRKFKFGNLKFAKFKVEYLIYRVVLSSHLILLCIQRKQICV